VYCGVLWCIVVYCGVLWCIVVYCGVLWCVVVCCVGFFPNALNFFFVRLFLLFINKLIKIKKKMTNSVLPQTLFPNFPLHFPSHVGSEFLNAIQDLKNVHVIEFNQNPNESQKSTTSTENNNNGIGEDIFIVLERDQNEELIEPVNDSSHINDKFSEEQKQIITNAMENIQSLQTVHKESENIPSNIPTKKPNQYTVSELREICKTHGLNSTGVKNVLIQRLQEGKFI
jgi:hypothetical protein